MFEVVAFVVIWARKTGQVEWRRVTVTWFGICLTFRQPMPTAFTSSLLSWRSIVVDARISKRQEEEEKKKKEKGREASKERKKE